MAKKIFSVIFFLVIFSLSCSLSPSQTNGVRTETIVVISTSGESISAQVPSPSLELTVEITEQPSSTPGIDYSQVNIFNETTWPQKYRDFAESGWIHSDDPARNDFQSFVDTARATFLVKEGIDFGAYPSIDNYGGIDEKDRTLWGMLEWYTKNIDKVKANNLKITVTPSEYENSILDERMPIRMTNSGISYYVDAIVSKDNWGTDVIGRPIAGRDNLKLNRPAYSNIMGVFMGVGTIGAGKNHGEVGIMDIYGVQMHLLAVFAIPDPDMVLPKGYICSNSVTGGSALTQDWTIGKDWVTNGKDDTWLIDNGNLKNMEFLFYYGPHQSQFLTCPHPVLGGEMASAVDKI